MSNLFTITQSLKPYALALTGSREDAEDLLQDAILRFLTARNKPIASSEITAFLLVVIKRLHISNRRRAMSSKHRYNGEGLPHFTMPNVEAVMEVKEVYKAMRSITPRRRQILSLSLLGFGQTEIAEMVGEKRNGVGHKLHWAKAQVKMMME